MVSFEIFVKAMPPSLWELKVLPSFCFAFKIPDGVAVTTTYTIHRDFEPRWLNNWRLIPNIGEKHDGHELFTMSGPDKYKGK